MTERVVLAYSGGLDTSVAIGWIAEETGAEVIAVAVDVGQGGEDLDVIRKRALDCGAVEAEVADASDEFANEYCLPAIKANALYMDRYPLVSALSRPHDRQAPRRRRQEARRHHRRPRLHGQGQRPGPLRGGHRRPRPRPQVHRPGPRLRDDPGQGDRLLRGEAAPDRDHQEVPVLHRPERLRARRRDGLPGGHLERADRGHLRIHLEPGPAARGRRGRHLLQGGRPGRHRRQARQRAAGHPAAQRPRRLPRASAGSTSSRTVSWASSPARCTRLRVRSR